MPGEFWVWSFHCWQLGVTTTVPMCWSLLVHFEPAKLILGRCPTPWQRQSNYQRIKKSLKKPNFRYWLTLHVFWRKWDSCMFTSPPPSHVARCDLLLYPWSVFKVKLLLLEFRKCKSSLCQWYWRWCLMGPPWTPAAWKENRNTTQQTGGGGLPRWLVFPQL